VEDAVCCAGVDDGLEVPGSLSALASHAHANEWIEMDCAVFLWKGTVGNGIRGRVGASLGGS
jgi:hypothetical protein